MDKKLTLQDLADGLARRKGLTRKDAELFARTVMEIIEQYLASEKQVKVKGLGTFKVVAVAGRESVNVNSGERFTIAGHSKVSFTPDAKLRDQVNKPFADFETTILNEATSTEEMERGTAEEPVLIPSEEAEAEVATTEPIVVDEPKPKAEPLVPKVEMPVIEEKEEDKPAPQPEPQKVEAEPMPSQSTSHGRAIARPWVIGAVVVVCIAAGYWFATLHSTEPEVKPTPEPKVRVDTVVVKPDTVTINPDDFPQLENGRCLIVGTKGTYKVKPGEMLTQIAKEKYGDAKYHLYIAVYNGIDPDDVRDGMTLKLPKLQKKDKTPEAEADTTTLNPDDLPQLENGRCLIVGTRETYTVGHGEMLTQIAKEKYGDAKYHLYIAVYNGIDPDDVRDGMTLKLPKLKEKKKE